MQTNQAELKKLYWEHSRRVIDAALRNVPQEELATLLDAAERYQKILKLNPGPSKKSVVFPSVVGLVFLICVVSVATVHLRRFTLIGQINCSEVRFDLLRPFELEHPLAGESIDLSNAPGLYGASINGTLAAGHLHVSGSRAELTSLNMDTPSILSVTAKPKLRLRLNGSLRGTLTLQGSQAELSNGEIREIDATFPETFYFSSPAEENKPPLEVDIDQPRPWDISGTCPSRISFFEGQNSDPNLPPLRSSVGGGHISIAETGELRTVLAGEDLVIGGFKCRWTRTISTPDGIQVQFEGTAQQVEAGFPSFHQNLNPTLLEYAYHQWTTSVFVGALIALWGAIVGLLKYFNSENEHDA